jgi:hypothetical protein
MLKVSSEKDTRIFHKIEKDEQIITGKPGASKGEEDFGQLTEVERGPLSDAKLQDLNTGSSEEEDSTKEYPTGWPFISLTFALMGSIFVAGLDQNILCELWLCGIGVSIGRID